MKKMMFLIAMMIAKLSAFALKLLGRNASFLPGKIALDLCKDFIGYLTPPETVICVTGTNGKTTVSNLINSILVDCGYDVTNNGLGSNVQAGVATALLLDSTVTGKAKKKIAVLEVDERSSLKIYPYLKPDYLICNNIMRDSLKRNAHTDFISFIINEALPEDTTVILNADDLICASLAPKNKNRVYFGVEAEAPTELAGQYVQDIVYCPVCGEKLESIYLRYNHIGRMRCTSCDYASPTPDFSVTQIDRENNSFTVRCGDTIQSFCLINDNIVNIYNFCGAIALLSTFGLTYEQIQTAFARSKIVKSRYDSFTAGKFNITMQLAKGQNPIACARCFNYVAQRPGSDKAVIVMIDDKGDNTGNSESVCWLYDCDYSYLADPSISQIIFAGPRCKDQYLRALIAGIPADKIKLTPEFTSGAEQMDPAVSKDIYVLYDPYLLSEANIVKGKLVQMGTEE